MSRTSITLLSGAIVILLLGAFGVIVYWEQVSKITPTIQGLLTSIALLAGAVWAFYRFIQFRTLKPRLEFAIKVQCLGDNNGGYVVIVGLKIFNKGNTKVNLRKDSNHRCYLKYGIVSVPQSTDGTSVISSPNKQLKHIDKVFTAHRWIEPNETIDDAKILHIPFQEAIAIQLEVEVFGEQKWSALGAFPLASNIPAPEYKSEDEQDVYEELEVWIADTETYVEKARQKIKASGLSDDQKKGIRRLIDEAVLLLSQLKITQKPSEKLAGETQEIAQGFKTYGIYLE